MAKTTQTEPLVDSADAEKARQPFLSIPEDLCVSLGGPGEQKREDAPFRKYEGDF